MVNEIAETTTIGLVVGSSRGKMGFWESDGRCPTCIYRDLDRSYIRDGLKIVEKRKAPLSGPTLVPSRLPLLARAVYLAVVVVVVADVVLSNTWGHGTLGCGRGAS
jgi:hypothetical protein